MVSTKLGIHNIKSNGFSIGSKFDLFHKLKFEVSFNE